MRRNVLGLAAGLAARGEPFALATVVRREPPSSAHVGDTALVTAGGEFHGWVGGACTRPTVLREALRAIADGEPRLLSLSPDGAGAPRPGVTLLPMTCHSGGTVDLYIEPVLPAPRLVVFGIAPAARALVRIGAVLGYAVDVVDPEAEREGFPDADRVTADVAPDAVPPGAFAVVATVGERDVEAIEAALALRPAYLGVIASRQRFAQVRDALRAGGAAAEAIGRIATPAGLDIGAKTPEEIALSIMAEIVQRRRRSAGDAATQHVATTATGLAKARDPVCGMTVDPTTAKHQAAFAGRDYYFCCGGCRTRFLASPEAFVAAAESGA
ncbi:MAG: XdhC family protein [Gemmatimonadetes bacterium]|nr:XdhC family protein [Gemmatimonadota bacterium]